MKPNESLTDRLVRVVLGSVMLFLAVKQSSGWWTLPLYIFGALLGITGLTGFCTFYDLFGISTWKSKRRGESESEGKIILKRRKELEQ